MLFIGVSAALALAPGLAPAPRVTRSVVSMDASKPVIIGLAADSGCGKSTFMRRVTGIFGGECKFNDIGRETNTLVSAMTTVICLDDYHKYDRTTRKSNPEFPDGITALNKDCQDWDKMAEDVINLKNGKAVEKPIYNHITGALDPKEKVRSTRAHGRLAALRRRLCLRRAPCAEIRQSTLCARRPRQLTAASPHSGLADRHHYLRGPPPDGGPARQRRPRPDHLP